MNIRFIHNYFHPDLSAVSQIVSEIAFHLAAKGYHVSIIASRNSYAGGESSTLAAREIVRGVLVRRIWTPSLGKGSLWARFIDQVFFIVGATVVALFAPRVDTVVLLTNPPLFAVLGLMLQRLRGERFVYVVMDLYPDVAIRFGLLRAGSLLARVTAAITRMTLKGADQVVVLGQCMRQAVITYGADPEKTIVIRNWADEKVIRPMPPNENEFRKAHGLGSQFVVMYSGNMGIAHRFEDILEVAQRLHGRSDIRFVFIGDGVRRKEIVEFQSGHNLANILIFPYQDRARLAEGIGAGDIHFVSLREGFEGLVVPSKTYGIMAMGRPILYQGNARGEIARVIIEKGFGEVIPEGDANSLEMAILRFYNNRALTDLFGKRARAVLEEEYGMQRAMDAYEGIFKMLAGCENSWSPSSTPFSSRR